MCTDGIRPSQARATGCILVATIVILTLGFLWVPSSPGQARDLLTTIRQPEAQLPALQQNLLGKLRAAKGLAVVRLVQINTALLGQEDVNIDLAPEARVRSARGTVARRDQRHFVWNTALAGRDASAVMVVNDQNVTGTIATDAGVYQIRPLGNGMHAVVKIDPNRLPADHPPSYTQFERRAVAAPDLVRAAQDAEPARDAMPTIRVLVAYTARVSSAVADVPGLIEVAVAETNQSYVNSAINGRLQLAHSYQVSYTESGSFDTDLGYFRGTGDGRMDEVHTLRRQHCADVCVLLIDNSSYCGLASTIMADAATAFAAVHYDCATGYYSFGHEIGHLMGARHNPEADPTNTPYAYGHGYLHGPQFRTVMAYNCPGGCPRRDYWSNPSVSLMGFSTGTANHDNARVLNGTAPVVANFVSLISCLRIDWGRLRYLTALCRTVGCNAVLRPGEDVAKPSPEYLRVVNAGGSNATQLQALRKNALQLVLRAERASPAEQAQIEGQAQRLQQQVQKLLVLRPIR